MEDVESQAGNVKMGAAGTFKKANRSVMLKFDEVVYTIKIKTSGSFLGNKNKRQEKLILRNISGVVKPGEMLAILGPSGSGKITLLTALGGRLSGHIDGAITYNGQPFSNAMKRNTGFVTQDDVLYPHLTVTETLVFTALLRLPNTLSKEEKVAQAAGVIDQLGLTNCKDSIIGGSLLRGVSGGERKRVSIGQEMLINPSLLFLDEPTSGLDSTTAQRIVSTLWELANGGRTVVMTIHQPSSRLFYMFHKVLLLSEGNPLYFGEGACIMDYFSSVGYAPSVAMNPSDFLLDLANGIIEEELSEDQIEVKQKLVSAYKANLVHKLKAELKERHFDQNYSYSRQNRLDDRRLERWPTTWMQQFIVLTRRGLKERKHESFSRLKIALVLVVSIISGLLWWRSTNLQDNIGLLFLYCVFWSFYPLSQAIFTFPQERVMLKKERSSGMYKLSFYFVSRMVGDLPMELVLPTAFVTISYWMAGLNPSALHFFHTLVVILYSVLAAQGLGLALGALVMDQKSVVTLGSVIMLSFMLAGGYYVQDVLPFIGWVKYLSTIYYMYKLLLGSQYNSEDTYSCGTTGGSCLVGEFPSIKKVGLDGQGVAVLALGLMLVGYRLVAYLALLRIGVTKK